MYGTQRNWIELSRFDFLPMCNMDWCSQKSIGCPKNNFEPIEGLYVLDCCFVLKYTVTSTYLPYWARPPNVWKAICKLWNLNKRKNKSQAINNSILLDTRPGQKLALVIVVANDLFVHYGIISYGVSISEIQYCKAFWLKMAISKKS